jgi:hypothetical protein
MLIRAPAGRCVFGTARSHVRWQLPIDALLNRRIGGKAVLHVD